jgi:hypothetical protein
MASLELRATPSRSMCPARSARTSPVNPYRAAPRLAASWAALNSTGANSRMRKPKADNPASVTVSRARNSSRPTAAAQPSPIPHTSHNLTISS